jgi:hypothetical protein
MAEGEDPGVAKENVKRGNQRCEDDDICGEINGLERGKQDGNQHKDDENSHSEKEATVSVSASSFLQTENPNRCLIDHDCYPFMSVLNRCFALRAVKYRP